VARIEPEPSDFDPEDFDEKDRQAAFAEGVQAFDGGQYHAAHECFERCWLANESGDADFYKGLVQASICMHHQSRGNLDGARPLNVGARRLLGAFLPGHEGLDLIRFLGELQAHVRGKSGSTPAPRMTPSVS
jgi:predicted metal-dependent hydrolase